MKHTGLGGDDDEILLLQNENHKRQGTRVFYLCSYLARQPDNNMVSVLNDELWAYDAPGGASAAAPPRSAPA